MKKIALFAIHPLMGYIPPHGNDHYDSFHSEGRILINSGFGLSLLGFEINIICKDWKINNCKKVWNNIYLSRTPKYEYYDYAVTWELESLKTINYGKAIFLDYDNNQINKVYEFIKSENKDIVFANINRPKIYLEREQKIEEKTKEQKRNNIIEVKYFPGLFPIPLINIGFIPYKFESDKTELKIYLNYRKDSSKYILKHNLIINFFKSKGYNVKLYVHMSQPLEYCPFSISNNIYNLSGIVDNQCRYIDVINAIQSSDVCLSSGTGTSHSDIISMGKPLIYISDNPIMDIKRYLYVDPLFKYPEYHIQLIETDEESLKKLEKFIENPKESYDKYAEAYKESNFNIWKKYMNQFFNPM